MSTIEELLGQAASLARTVPAPSLEALRSNVAATSAAHDAAKLELERCRALLAEAERTLAGATTGAAIVSATGEVEACRRGVGTAEKIEQRARFPAERAREQLGFVERAQERDERERARRARLAEIRTEVPVHFARLVELCREIVEVYGEGMAVQIFGAASHDTLKTYEGNRVGERFATAIALRNSRPLVG